MFRYELGQVVYYLKGDVVHSAPIISRKLVDNAIAQENLTKQQEEFFCQLGKSGESYATCHGVFPVGVLYPTREALFEKL